MASPPVGRPDRGGQAERISTREPYRQRPITLPGTPRKHWKGNNCARGIAAPTRRNRLIQPCRGFEGQEWVLDLSMNHREDGHCRQSEGHEREHPEEIDRPVPASTPAWAETSQATT